MTRVARASRLGGAAFGMAGRGRARADPLAAAPATGKCNTTRERRETHQHERRGADQHEARGDALDDAISGVSGPPRAARGGIQQTRHLLVDACVAHLASAGVVALFFALFRRHDGCFGFTNRRTDRASRHLRACRVFLGT